MVLARIISPPLPKEATEIKVVETQWGLERSYKTTKGNIIYSPAPFSNHNQI